MSQWIVLEMLRQDFAYGLRTLDRNRGFTIVAIAMLALGIGANTAIFSLLIAVELRRLPGRGPQELVTLEWNANQRANWAGYSSYRGCDAAAAGLAASWGITGLVGSMLFGVRALDVFHLYRGRGSLARSGGDSLLDPGAAGHAG